MGLLLFFNLLQNDCCQNSKLGQHLHLRFGDRTRFIEPVRGDYPLDAGPVSQRDHDQAGNASKLRGIESTWIYAVVLYHHGFFRYKDLPHHPAIRRLRFNADEIDRTNAMAADDFIVCLVIKANVACRRADQLKRVAQDRLNPVYACFV